MSRAESSDAGARTALYGNSAPRPVQRAAFTGGDVPVAVYGLGKMGLPLAAVYAEVTGNVTGVDVDPEVAGAVAEGACHVEGEPELDELVAELAEDGSLTATTDGQSAAADARLHVAIVPTLVEDDEPDLTAMESVMADIASGLEPGDMVVAESTLPPRSCVDRLLPILEESGLELGEFGLAFCPERTKSGRALEDIRGTHPKIVGGADEESSRVAELVYGQLTDNEVVEVSDTTTAEAVKVFEGVYRDVNIGLANELGRHAAELGIDVTEAIEAANTQPFCEIHTPGAGVGGHCIPYYPHFLMAEFDTQTPVMRAARETNEEMPRYTAQHALDGLHAEGVAPEDASVLVLGLTYRPGVDEIRATPALPVVETLTEAGAAVTAVDPVNTTPEPFEAAGATLADLDDVREGGYDAVVLVTPQPAFDELDVPSLGAPNGRLVLVDGRQEYTDLRDHDGIHYRGIGVNA